MDNQNPVPTAIIFEKPKVSGADVFLHIGAFLALYTSIVSLLVLLYTIIDSAFPPISSYGSYYNFYAPSSISFQVATLVVSLPLYLILSSIIQKRYIENPERKETKTRRGLIYLTLFVSGVVMSGDLITVVYSFLNGEDITISFVLKALSVLIIFAGVFVYYIQDVRNKLSLSLRNTLRLFAILLVVLSVISGFAVLGSPRTQRLQKFDQQKIVDLQDIQNQLIRNWQDKGELPNSLSEINNSLSYYQIKKDPQTGLDYEYRKILQTSFELCAVFNVDQPKISTNSYSVYNDPTSNWDYQKGRHCFKREIDTQRYPTFKVPLGAPAIPVITK